jgi:hypothetical protein
MEACEMTRSIIMIGAVVITLGISWAYISSRQNRLENEFNAATLGSTTLDVTAYLGAPWKRAKCGEVFGGNTPQNCDSEIVYASPFAPMLPEYWAFRYDRDGKLIDKYHYVSP